MLASALQKNSSTSAEPARGIARQARAVFTDSHFWAPFLVLVAGLALLVALH